MSSKNGSWEFCVTESLSGVDLFKKSLYKNLRKITEGVLEYGYLVLKAHFLKLDIPSFSGFSLQYAKKIIRNIWRVFSSKPDWMTWCWSLNFYFSLAKLVSTVWYIFCIFGTVWVFIFPLLNSFPLNFTFLLRFFCFNFIWKYIV